jgi:hypothetical protein
MTRNMRESLAEDDPDLLFADGFDDAILGVVRRVGQEAFVLYDTERCIEILMRDGTAREEAEEYFGFNVEGAWVGERTPGFVSLPEADDEEESDDE